MCLFLHGPASFKDSDLDLLRDCNLNELLCNLQQGHEQQFCSYGDGIFPIKSHIIGKHRVTELTTQDERNQNAVMTRIRIANEWAYSIVTNKFPFAKCKRSMKICGRTRRCIDYYAIATLLRNASNCLYSSQATSYFGICAPTLEHYFLIM
jgi:hypothetical protein